MIIVTMVSILIDNILLLKIILAMGAISISSGVIGCFVIWQRMAYFSDALSHSALLGVVLGMLLGMTNIFIVLVSLLFAFFLAWILQKNILSSDATLGVFAHSGLGIGVMLLSLMGEETDIHHYLFGDVMTISWEKVGFLLVLSVVTILLLAFFWSRLLLVTMSEEMAMSEGISRFKMRLLLVGLLAGVIASSIQVIGVLLMTSLLIIPSATAKIIAKSPESMAIFAAIIGFISAVSGSMIAMHYAIPIAPMIVIVATAIFIPTICLYRRL